MSESSLLLTTAQIGMALAGFAGLVTVLGRPSARHERLLNEIRLRSMVELSLALVAVSLLPFVPDRYGVPAETLWRLCSGLYALAAVVFVAHGVWRNLRRMGRIRVAGRVTTLLITLGAALALFLAANAAGLFTGHESAGYFAALFVHFLAAAFFFLRLLYAAMPRDGEPAAWPARPRAEAEEAMPKSIETPARGEDAEAPQPREADASSESPALVCAEYTPELQIRLLGIEPATLAPPILDLGCGASASLVRHLRDLGLRDVVGLDPQAPEGVGFVRASWLELSFPPATWGTVIAHQSFSLHFLRAHLRSEREAARFARKYLEILRGLRPSGRFFYAPGLPFVEEHLDPREFRVERRSLPVASIPVAARDLAALYGPTGLYAASVERLSEQPMSGGT